MNTRNTKQKEIILDTLQHMYNHPTILELYAEVKKNDASIGQATVYRNISKLVDEGVIQRITTYDGIERYDSNTIPHYHFICQKCHKLYDLHDSILDDMVATVNQHNHMNIICVHLLIEGICCECSSSVSLR